MKILGIESSSKSASVAIIEDQCLLGEYTINHTLKHSKTLMPMIKELMGRLELKPQDIGLIAISEGPGSFTGLRIGSATAKGLAQGLNIPIASIPTMEVLASSIQIPNACIHVLMYARARELYYQVFESTFNNQRFSFKAVSELETYEIEELVKKLNVQSGEGYIVGDGAQKFEKELSVLKENVKIMPAIYTNLLAKNVAILGQSRYDYNDVMTYQDHRPYYHKKSQAEREYESKQNAKNSN